MSPSTTTAAQNFITHGRKILAIGRNYKKHAAELGNSVPSEPILFLKPTTSYLQQGQGKIEIPHGADVHHEVELGVVIGNTKSTAATANSGIRNVKPADAMKYVAGYALALDMTARNTQQAAQKAGLPWTIAKGYDTFTPISSFIPASKVPDSSNVGLWCKVNDKARQAGNTMDMVFDVKDLVAFCSTKMTLQDGDLILTGTPEGVASVKNGDVIECGLAVGDKELASIKFGVKDREE